MDRESQSVCVDAVSVGESRVSSFLSRILKPKSDAERRVPLRLTLIGTFDPLISFLEMPLPQSLAPASAGVVTERMRG